MVRLEFIAKEEKADEKVEEKKEEPKKEVSYVKTKDCKDPEPGSYIKMNIRILFTHILQEFMIILTFLYCQSYAKSYF